MMHFLRVSAAPGLSARESLPFPPAPPASTAGLTMQDTLDGTGMNYIK